MTQGGVSVPATPTNPNPGSLTSPGPLTSSSTVTLSWTGSSGATSYGVGVRDIASGLLVVDTSTTGTSFTAALSPGHQYRWNVDACNNAGCIHPCPGFSISYRLSARCHGRGREIRRVARTIFRGVRFGNTPFIATYLLGRPVGASAPSQRPSAWNRAWKIHADRERINQVEALGVLGQDWRECA